MNSNFTKLHDTLDKSPHNSNVANQQQHNYPSHIHRSQAHNTAYRPSEVVSTGQIQNGGDSHGDTNKRSDGITLEPNHQPIHTANYSGATFTQPLQPPYSTRASAPSTQPQGMQYNDGPRGQPFSPTLSLPEDTLPTISKDSKYIKLNLTRQQIKNLQCEEYKIAFFGAPRVGKSSIIRRFIDDQFTEDGYTQSTTLEQKKVFLRRVDNNKNYKLTVWDIGNADDSEMNDANIFDKCGVAIIVFDVNEYKTPKVAGQMWEKVKGKVGDYPTKFLLVGNKCDLPENDNVKKNKQRGRMFANEKEIQYYETSAKMNGIEIYKLFEKVVDKAIEASTQFQNNARENRDDRDNRNGGICVLL